jgi:Flp pilus assembly protein TadD
MGLDRYDEALATIGAGLEIAPGDANLLSDKGLAYLRMGETESAATYFRRALESNPNLLSARGNLAVAYERLGDEAGAREQYRIYLETAPPGPSRDRAAAALRQLGG